MTSQRLKIQFLLGLVVSAFFLYLAFRGVQINELSRALKQANYWYLIPSVTLGLFSFVMRAHRWRFMLHPIKSSTGLNNLFASTMIGFMANNILPFRLGEIARAYSLGRLEKVSRSAAFATIILERVFDVAALVTYMALILLWFPFPPHLTWIVPFALIFFVAVLFALILLKVYGDKAARVVANCFRLLPGQIGAKLGEITFKFTHGLGMFSRPLDLLLVSVYSLLIYLVLAASNYFVMLGFGLKIPVLASLVLLVVVSLGIILPAAPGFVGTYQSFCIWSLAPFAVDKNTALSLSIVLHASQYVPVTLMGLYYLRKKHLSLKEVEPTAGGGVSEANPGETRDATG